MQCDRKADKRQIIPTDPHLFNPNSCHNNLTFVTKEACPLVNMFTVTNFIKNNKIAFGIALLLLGLFLTFLGAKFTIVTIFIIITMATTTLCFVFMFGFILPNSTAKALPWVVLGISGIVGLVLGYFVAKYNKSVIGMILGGYMGYLLGLICYTSMTVNISGNQTVKNNYLF
jgi:hypothetical protein